MKLESESEFLLIIMMVLWVKFFERVMQHLQCMTQVSNLPALPYTSRLIRKPTPSPYSVIMIIHLPLSRNDTYNFRNGFYYTLTNLSSSCPRSLLKTTPTPPGCPWVPGGPGITPEPSFRGLVLDHQALKKLDLNKHSKTVVFDQI